MLKKDLAIDLIKRTVFETMGCTEPAAIALAVATSKKYCSRKISSIDIFLDRAVYKNAAFVGIPGTEKAGIRFAVALAIFLDPEKDLLIFEDISPSIIKKAKNFLKRDVIKIHHSKNVKVIDIKATIKTEKDSVTTWIKSSHNNIVSIEKNGSLIFEKKESMKVKKKKKREDISLFEILAVIKKLKDSDLLFLKECVEVNLKAAKKALQIKNNTGTSLKELYESYNLETPINKIKYMAAAAASARMMGKKIEIKGCGGSGNHGITFFTAVGLFEKEFKIEKKISLQKALALGLLLLISIKAKTGLLTPMCGCSVAAGAAAAGAISFLIGGDIKKIEASLNLVFANLSGLICDGAKDSCSLKIATSVEVSIESALLANRKKSFCGQGITSKNFPKSLENLGLLHKLGMSKMDNTILNIFSTKSDF